MLDPSKPLLLQLPAESGLAGRLRSLIKQIGPTRFLQLTGISKAQLNRYIHGTPIPSNRLAAIALVGGISLDWLINGNGNTSQAAQIDYTSLGNMVQSFFEVNGLYFSGNAWKPSELHYVVPLLLMNERHVARQGGKWKFNNQDMLDTLTFLDGMRQRDALQTYTQTVELLSSNPDISFEEKWAGPFCSIVNTALKHYYNSEVAHGYYDRIDQGLGVHNLQWVRNFIDQYTQGKTSPKQGKLLDVGCGSGRYMAYFQANYDSLFDVYGVEQASYAIKLCEQHIKAKRLRPGSVKQGDVIDLDYPDNNFDAVISYLVLHYFPHVKQSTRYGVGKVLSEIYRVLKPGGLAHIVIPRDTDEEFLPIYSVSHQPVLIFELLSNMGAKIRDCTPFERQASTFPGNIVPNNLEAFYCLSFSKPV
jgi:ubiquinone/menaquinone biosynthesis C-methylase UbiE